MKKIKQLLVLVLMMVSTGIYAQSARQTLDKATAIINNKGGVTAHFTMSRTGMPGRTAGVVYIKGNKFTAQTEQMTVWFDGKTQWSYMKSTNEVNVSNPTTAQKAAMNPLSLVNLYKSGYNLAQSKSGTNKIVHLTSANGRHSITEMYITVTDSNMVKTIKMKQSGKWTTINVSNIRAARLSDATFTFNKRKYPTAEIVDLR